MRIKRDFMNNRCIGENIRLVNDLMVECDIQKRKGILVLVDFEKASDTLDWKFIHKIFRYSNFGNKIQKWLKILQKSKVVQNGFFSEDITGQGL